MQLPKPLPLDLMQTKWAGILNPLLSNPLNGVQILKNVSLENGVNVVPHKLGQIQQGWFITDIQGSATVYRSAPFNNLTLTLTSSASVVCSIGVF